uniref:DNA-directed RNA polymerase subunit alpha n=1 Tax=Cyanidiococcus yangmingshanensis TaxID=2690220 RepID=A0A7G5VUN4_9RHOD|nr:DNA-directed RNA polymerase alpha subunit [Cyanidiococcus yangmingshanensis]QMX77401.1 DNA-directed RNA polymerase alpha subunit [Cyanidiococcus yangmingshanensis]WDB00493.1 RNA polymerase alpha subunit [Cyanidiococcus yangmingshanensis]
MNFQIECSASSILNPREVYAKFLIQPLNHTQAITIGNALRRVLLSELETVAITAVRIAGATHELATLEGVREDVLQIMLNLKQIVWRGHLEQPSLARIKVQGPAIVTAAAFQAHSEVTVVDSCQYIATVDNEHVLELECQLEQASGYRLSNPSEVIDWLPIDGVFMPVKRVNFWVDKALHLEICTNGSLSPQEALHKAASILTNWFNPLQTLEWKTSNTKKDHSHTQLSQMLIEQLDLSVRAYNCLKRAQIHSVADLMQYTQEELLALKNFGQKSVEEVNEALEQKLHLQLPKKIC